MQIHELTRKRPVKEGVLGAALGGVASQLANKAMASQGITPASGSKQKATAAGAQDAAFSATDPLIKGLATAAAKEWKQTVSELMQKEKTPAGLMATRPSELPPAQLQQVLGDMVSRLIGEPYESLVNKVSAEAHDGTGKQYAAKLTTSIKNQIDAIVAQEQTAGKPDPNKESALWSTLAAAISDAKSEIEFSSSGGRGAVARPGLLPPASEQLADELGMSDQTIAALQNYIRLNGSKITPALAALLGGVK